MLKPILLDNLSWCSELVLKMPFLKAFQGIKLDSNINYCLCNFYTAIAVKQGAEEGIFLINGDGPFRFQILDKCIKIVL